MTLQTLSLHPAQQDVYLDQAINTDTPYYNMGGYLKLTGRLNKEKFIEAVRSAPEVFDVLKMRFDLRDEEPVAYVDETYSVFELTEMEFPEGEDKKERVEQWIREKLATPFRVEKDIMLADHYLIHISEEEHWYYFRYHHLIVDGYGVSGMLHYIAKKYKSLVTGEPVTFNYPSYIEEAKRAAAFCASEAYAAEGEYWKQKIGTLPPKLLQKRFVEEEGMKNKCNTFILEFAGEERALLEALQADTNANLQQLTIAAMMIYYARTSGQEDFIFGIPLHRRRNKLLRAIAGMFTGVIPFTGSYKAGTRVSELIRSVISSQREDYRYQNYLIGDLSRHFKVGPDDGLIEIAVNFAPVDFTLDLGEELSSVLVNIPSGYLPFPIEMFWYDYGKQQPLQLRVDYQVAYFNKEEISALVHRLLYVLHQFRETPDVLVEQVNLLPAKEQVLLAGFSSPTPHDPYGVDDTLPALFSAQARAASQRTAVVYRDAAFSYGELEALSNRLSHYLHNKGVQTDKLVPICLERSMEMFVAILAIWKAGGAYVPVDTTYPAERIAYLLEDTTASLVICSRATRHLFGGHVETLIIDELPDEMTAGPEVAPAFNPAPQDLSYVIYTSGSTGKPKGVMVEHRGMLNHLYAKTGDLQIDAETILAFTASYTFDISVWQMFAALMCGGHTVVYDDDHIYQPAALISAVEEDQVTILELVPSYLAAVLQEKTTVSLNRLQYLMVTGEAVSQHLLQQWFTHPLYGRIPVVNAYGPTEASDDITHHTMYETPASANVPLGRPVRNMDIYIVSQDMELCPIGVAGEICVAGIGVSRGYLGRPELTAEKFISDPLTTGETRRMYRTGDLGRWSWDGTIEYLGRMDDQVKIRGYRIELGEIEAVLHQLPFVNEAVVVAREDKGHKQLVAYVVAPAGFERETALLHLKDKLPEYMIPVIVELEKMPLTPNGKVDKRALPDPLAEAHIADAFVAPRNKTEQTLADIWQDLLRIEKVGIHDNFFELGGNSLLGIRMIAVISRTFNADLTVRALFRYATIATLAAYIRQQSGNRRLQITAQPHITPKPLSFSQERLWFIDSMEGSEHYHIPLVLKLKGHVDRDALQFAFQSVINRHEVLRTVVYEQEGTGYQLVLAKDSWQLEEPTNEGNVQQAISHFIYRPFDLSKDHMLRAALLKQSEDEHTLVITVHHIAADAWSMALIIKEFAAYYNEAAAGQAAGLPELPLQYTDYAIWQRASLSAVLSASQQYWKKQLAGIEPLNLSTDYPRPAIQSKKGAVTHFSIGKEMSEKLYQLGRQQDTTLFVTLLSAFKVLLFRYTGQQDICVGTPVAGRTQQELESMAGFFVDTLPLYSHLDADTAFSTLLQQEKEVLLEGYEHQDLPFEKIVEAVTDNRDLSRTPLFQAMFVLQDAPDFAEVDMNGLTLSPGDVEHTISKFDITVFVTEKADELTFGLEYCTDLFNSDTIERMGQHYLQLLESVTEDPAQLIGALNMLTAAEQYQLLEIFPASPLQLPVQAPATLVSLFRQQALLSANAVALVSEGIELTYRELDERSNQVAHYLQVRGVKAESLVAVCMDRSPLLVICMLGILKAGGAYVPLDAGYPRERIAYMLADSGSELVLTTPEYASLFSDVKGDVILVDENVLEDIPVSSLKDDISEKQLAYVIYTSGSTGRPKGVMIEHHSVVDLVRWHTAYYAVSTESHATAMASIGFDAFGWELWPYLCAGAGIWLLDDEARLSPETVVSLYVSAGITHSFVATGLVPEIIQALRGREVPLQYLLTGGDRLSSVSLSDAGYQLVNNYGPTENTVVTSSYLMPADGGTQPSIGKAVSNTRIYITDTALRPVPVGVAGELCVSGSQLSRGYLGQPELTAEKFVVHPFRAGERLYRTGDLARWLPDGNIAFVGRKDEQVKVRGYRIELGEISAVLQQSGLVEDVVVIARKDTAGNNYLVAYIITKEGDMGQITEWLRNKLPEYMLPLLVKMEAFPLTASGKVDRRALPEPVGSMVNIQAYVAPRTHTEQLLVNIWQELLDKEQIGIQDHFFHLGGHSLMAIRLIAAVRKELHAELSVRDVFTRNTIETLAAFIDQQQEKTVLPEIIVQNKPPYIPLSFSQERLWFIDKLEGSMHYHTSTLLKLKGKVNRQALQHALHHIVERHEALRTVFRENEGIAYQLVLPADNWQLLELASAEDFVAYSHQSFDLTSDYMMRAALLQSGNETYELMITMHHIASDGWSVSILAAELSELYDAYTTERQSVLKPLAIQYADYAIWQKTYVTGEVLSRQQDYWLKKMSGLEPLNLHTDYARPAVQRNNGALFITSIDRELTDKINVLSRQQGVTPFMTLLAAFKVLLYRYSGQDDICVGTPLAGRKQQEVESLIGFFINTLAVRSDLGNNPGFDTFLQQVKNTLLEGYEHQDMPFEKVVDTVVRTRDLSRHPLFQVMFLLHNTPDIPAFSLGDLAIEMEEVEETTAKFDLIFTLQAKEDELLLGVEYCTDLFCRETVERMAEHYKQLLLSVTAAPAQQISTLNMLTAPEKQTLQTFATGPVIDLPADQTVVTLFEEQVQRYPDAVAIQFEETEITYHTLHERTNQLAHLLRSKGIGADSKVPVFFDRCPEMIIAVLSIWKAGGAYVPIDPKFPEERVRYILEETAAQVVVTNQRSSVLLPADITAAVISADEEDILSNQPRTALQPVATQQHLAYVLYTSGSTGKPKGVLVEHAGLLNHLLAMIEEFDMSPSTILAFTAPYTFDISVWQMVNALVCGGRTVIYTESLIHRPDLFIKTVEEQGVTLLQLVPSYLTSVLQEEPDVTLQSLDYLLVTGEAVTVSLLEQWFAHERFGNIIVANAYGPTEASDDVSFYFMNEAPDVVQVPVGTPIRNLRMYVLDNNLQLCPQGVPGEICVAGLAVARGYLNRPELTAAKFVEDPFCPGERMYRTGDLGRWLPDGNMEYIGRADDQVKIRGFRIELGEIEHTLQQYPQIAQAVVVAKSDDKGIKRLVGYLVPEGELDKDTLTVYLKERLPEYMIPVLVVLDKLPLTTNGKVDKKALPDPAAGAISNYVAPRNPLESQLADIWQRLLGISQAGIYDNFFELGGHSLLVIRLIAAIRKEIGAELQVKDVFIHSDIASLAAGIDVATASLLPPVTRIVPAPEQIPLSFSQERLWFIDKLEGSTHYHNPSILTLTGAVSADGIAWALQQVINRHEVLRTVIREADGTGYQHILPSDSWKMESIDTASGQPAAIAAFVGKPFDLSRDHMLRAALISDSANDHVLVIVVHHIAFDGWSSGIVIGELSEYYAAYIEKRDAALEPLALQYSDYAIWQRTYLNGPVLETLLQYWKQQLSGIDALNMPTDYARPLVQSTKGAMLTFHLENSLAGALNDLSRQQGVTLFMTLLATFKVLLYRYTGQQDICVGTPVAGRGQQEIENLAGFFINTLALRSQPDGALPFDTYLQQVKTTLLEAYEHQELPFERIVDAVVKNRDLSRSPLFQVMLVLQNTPEEAALKLGDAVLTEEETELTTAKYDLIFVLEEKKDGLLLNVEYCTDLFSAATATQLGKHYEQLLKAVTTTPEARLSLLQMITSHDEQLLLKSFNGPAVGYPEDKTIVTLFEEQVDKTPELTAVVYNSQRLTYRELDERSNQLAHYLRIKGVQEETLVPVCMGRGLEMIISMLAILKAGGAYVPVDPDYPEDRVHFMLEDTGAKLAISTSADSTVLRTAGIDTLIEMDTDSAIAAQPRTRLNTGVKPGNVAYVIYTSGSTGRPKGVLIEHINVVRLFETETPLYDFNSHDVWTMFHSFSFDFSVWEMYGALFYGGRLVIVPKDVARDVTRFGDLLISEKVTVLNQTPSAFYVLQDYLTTRPESIAVRYVIFGGEALNPAKLRPWKERFPASRLINMYGITETTVHVTFIELKEVHLNSSASAIGRPIPTLNAYILDSEQQPSPVGVTGELYIGGAGVARGYLNRPELTAARFLASPFKAGERLYRTGDLARWYHDGNIEYQGRIDDQVKIRGFRIELGEIENAIQGSGVVSNSVVLAKTVGTGDKQLVAYVVPGENYSREAVIGHLKELLPEYMIPSIWVVMEAIPLTSNGKVNRKALPEPDTARLANVDYVAPRTATEISLAAIWQELLGAERVGVNDNFFELGGDSIRVIKVASRIYHLFHKEVKVFEVYQAATLGELARVVDNKAATAEYREAVYQEVNETLDRQKESLLPLLKETANIEDLYPVSDIERGMLFISLMNPTEALYHDQFVGKLPKTFDATIVRQAYELLIARHSILRTGFRMGLHDQDIQIVYKSVQVEVPTYDIRHLSGPEVKAAIEQYLEEERTRPFVIEDAPLWRASLFSLKDCNLLVFQFHHAILDGWSVASLNTELYNLCTALVSNKTMELPAPLRASYKDYIIERLVTKKLDDSRNFWEAELTDYKRLDIFTDEPVLEVVNYRFDERYAALLRERTRWDNISIKGLALGAYLYTLSLLTYEGDLTVGLVTNTRPLVEDADRLLGCFLNTIPLRYNMDNSLTWKSYFEGVEAKLLSLKERDRTSLFEITKITGEHSSNNNPYFDTIFNFINFHVYDGLKDGMSAMVPEDASELPAINDFELTNTFLDCTVSTTGDTFTVQLSLRRKLSAGKKLEDLIYYFRKIINAYLEHYEEPLTTTDILSPEENRLVLEKFPASPLQLPAQPPATLVSLFKEQVALRGAELALVSGDIQLSYRELDERSNQVAHYLQSRGVKAESLVAVCMDRRPLLVVCMLGILKAGGAYVPLDAGYPRERIAYMLADSGSELVLTTSKYASLCSDTKATIILTDENIWEDSPVSPLKDSITEKQLAYVIYTSGSTGRPKGVMIEHHNVVNLVRWHAAYYEVSAASRATAMASIGFDAFGWELWPYLCAGAGLWLLDDDARLSPETVVSLYASAGITHSFVATGLVPEIMQALRGRELPLQYLLTGGDRLASVSLSDTRYQLVNNYGPTENTVVTSSYLLPVDGSTQPSIGRAISNTRIYITDTALRPVPVGVAGELCVSGNQLSRGYLGQPELTAEKFVAHPFRVGERLYRTGDLARWLPDGNIEFFGRKDEQVKIRGYRIELGEIENVLLQSGLVNQTIVTATPDARGIKRLIAYIVSSGVFDEAALNNFLQGRLPAYMLPSRYVALAELPLTANGKIDRRALPEPEEEEQVSGYLYAAPRNAAEAALALIWEELLGTGNVGIHDNFFRLGGDSIISIQLASRARQAGINLQVKDVFQYQTIAQLSAVLADRHKDGGIAPEQGVLKGIAGLLPVQQQYLHNVTEAPNHLSQVILLETDKDIAPEVLEAAVRRLQEQHDALRFVYRRDEGGWLQEYSDHFVTLYTEDLSAADRKSLGAQLADFYSQYQPDLNNVVKAVWIKMPAYSSHHRLLLAVHPIVADRVSMGILQEDLQQLIHHPSKETKEKTASYRQWYEQLTKYAKSEQLLSQKRYWQQAMQQRQPLLAGHTSVSPVSSLKNTSTHLDVALTSLLLKDVQATYHTAVSDILLAALTRTLAGPSGSQEIVIGLESDGREMLNEALDISRTVGCFTSVYPLLLNTRDCTDDSRLIRSVKEQLLHVPDNGLGFGILKYMMQEPGLQRENPYQLVFNYTGHSDRFGAGDNGVTGSPFHGHQVISVHSFVKEGELYINWSYNNGHFSDATITTLSSSYLRQLELLIDHCVQLGRLGSVPTPWGYGLPATVGYKALDKFLESPVSATNSISRLQAISEVYTLTPLQEGMLFHGLYDKDSAAYIEQFSCDLPDVDVQALQRSWNQLLNRHTILRTGFSYEDLPVPAQYVYKTLTMPFETVDYRDLPEDRLEAAIDTYIRQDRERGFNYEEAPLMRITLIQTGERNYHMLWSFHHLLLDGWSVSLVLGELLQQYEYEVKGGVEKSAPEDKYSEYIRYIGDRNKWKEQEYWSRYMEGLETATLLPFIKTTSNRNKGVGQYQEQQLLLGESTTLQITETAKRYGITVNTLMQGVWALLLHKYTGLQNIVYGVSVSGRPASLQGVEHRAGLYINTLPLHTRFEKNIAISSWLQQIQKNQVQSREYEYTSLNRIQALTGITGDLFDSLLVFDNYPVSEALKAGEDKWSLKAEHVRLQEQTNFPLDILIALSKEKTSITFNYNTELLEEQYMRQLAGHFESVLLQFLDNGQQQLGAIKLLTSEETQVLQALSAGPVVPWPEDQTLASLFEKQALMLPEAVAIEFEGSTFTYRELNERANQLAHFLRGKGVKENVLVPICIDRSLEMILGILGIVKAGGAYVPVDPGYPQDRIEFILEDVKATVVLTNQRCSDQLPANSSITVICLDDDKVLTRQPVTTPGNVIATDHLCYVIYTSGSTGRPKGVMIEHAGMVNHLYAKINDLKVNAATTIAFTASYTFDISVWQMFAALVSGGRTIIYPADTVLNPAALITKVAEDRVNILELVPSYLAILLQHNVAVDLKKLCYLLVTGETVTPSLLKQWFSHPHYKHIPVVNAYGPTEASDDITHYFMDEAPETSSVPLGRPVQNLQIEILDLTDQLCPIGVPGEITVSGIGVGRGYLNRADLTAEKFVCLTPGSGLRSYRTGDLGRWLPDGNIEYLGRIDHQVKIRGNRIELGEIESVLQQYELIHQSVVIVRKDTQGISQLIGYIVPGQPLKKEDVLAYLRERLPEYMIPLLVELAEMPLTPNGKIDRKALPEPDAGQQSGVYTAPRNTTEETLAGICQELLNADRISVNVNLFELGMHSLMVMRFTAAVLEALQIEIPVKTFFEQPTIEALAVYAEERKAGESRKRKRIAL
ncbi:non-ribosomal peptide synthase/polyketide synthase [Chitinophaga sp. HK235]|uniref:non-ribosomal peptide synthetase n=1 Tax=Chitinophaga sp. HK235 TaxID=2952571 RepID=UPI001BA78F3F|nr:non-ribosomal peptide synthase/polyketide synthase [Chitinophaga sp. HK235]